LRREIIETSGVQHALTRIWRHRPQSVDSIADGPAPVRRQAVELLPNASQILFLSWRQMLPRFHAAQYLLLPLGRHAVEPLQTLLILPLRFAR
jgi:hypothetical protein